MELIVVVSVMVGLLLAMYMANNFLSVSWETQRQALQASTATEQVALAINRAVAAGNSTTIVMKNYVGPDITNMTVYDGRSVRAYYIQGGYSSSALITNLAVVTNSAIPLNRDIAIINRGGTIYVEEV